MPYLLTLLLFTLSLGIKAESPLEIALSSDLPEIKGVVEDAKKYELQILFAEISNTGEGLELETSEFGLSGQHYFYPASTVKLPMALFALEFLNRQQDITFDSQYTMEADPSSYSVKSDIIMMLGISDDQAYNRLYNLIGRDYINRRLREIGLRNTRISHRLSVTKADEATLVDVHFTGISKRRISFAGRTDRESIEPIALVGTLKGDGYIKSGSLITEPFNFTNKNYYSLHDQMGVLSRLTHPELYPVEQRYRLTSEQREWLLEILGKTPRMLGFKESQHPDSYTKFWTMGNSSARLSDDIRIVNKVGWAYGTLTDCAMITILKTEKQFYLCATLLANKNQIFNDDDYQYEEVALPFFATLGTKIIDIINSRSNAQ